MNPPISVFSQDRVPASNPPQNHTAQSDQQDVSCLIRRLPKMSFDGSETRDNARKVSTYEGEICALDEICCPFDRITPPGGVFRPAQSIFHFSSSVIDLTPNGTVRLFHERRRTSSDGDRPALASP